MGLGYLLSTLALTVIGCLGDTCYYDDFQGRKGTMFCSHGCCGYKYEVECCDFSHQAGIIAGIVIGTLCAIGLIIICIICVCRKTRRPGGKTGTVLQPTENVGYTAAGHSNPVDLQCEYPATATQDTVLSIPSRQNNAQLPPAYKTSE